MTAVPVILDVDTGVDDAFAVLLAARHPGLELRAVTCVAGNVDVDGVVRNTLTVLDAAGRSDVPVGRGAERPLLDPARPARHVHGEDGMGDLGLPVPDRQADPRHAVELLRDVLLRAATEKRPVTLVPLAPMTNIALLLRTYPEAAAGIGRIVFMGGAALVGNATAAAEFNIYHDPESAAVVLDAAAERQIPVTMYGLDVFYELKVTEAAIEELGSSPSASAQLAGRLLTFQLKRFGAGVGLIGDAGAVCSVIDPGGLTTRELPVRIELAGTWTRGQTVVDQRDWRADLAHDPHGLAPAVIDVALGIEADSYIRLWLDAVR
jgi:pyrimidine-specific ribonucleoside hydrolase